MKTIEAAREFRQDAQPSGQRGRGPRSREASGPCAGVVVLDSHGMVRVGFATAVARHGARWGLAFAGEAATSEDLRSLLGQVTSRVVVLDPGLSDGSDVAETVRWLLGRGQRVFVYTPSLQSRQTRRAVQAGAHGVSGKFEALDVTLAKVRAVAAGRCAIPLECLLAARVPGAPVLSPRETEVLALYVSGHEMHAIAAALFLTENSVKEYLRRVRCKYADAGRSAPTKVDLLRRAIEDGVVPPIEPH